MTEQPSEVSTEPDEAARATKKPAVAARAVRNAGRRVLVTGAGSGMGLATVNRLVEEEARVAGWDVRPPDQLANGVRWWRCDVSDGEAVAAAMAETVSWLGGLDAVVHVAGIIAGSGAPVDQLQRADWNSVIDVNLTGPYLVAHFATPYLERSHGALILVGSGAGIYNAHRSVPYAASKGGLHGLAITLEEPLRARGIRVIDIAPGSVDTPLLRAQSGQSDQEIDARRAAGEIIDAPAVAHLMAFLVSDEASAVRGTIRTW